MQKHLDFCLQDKGQQSNTQVKQLTNRSAWITKGTTQTFPDQTSQGTLSSAFEKTAKLGTHSTSSDIKLWNWAHTTGVILRLLASLCCATQTLEFSPHQWVYTAAETKNKAQNSHSRIQHIPMKWHCWKHQKILQRLWASLCCATLCYLFCCWKIQ